RRGIADLHQAELPGRHPRRSPRLRATSPAFPHESTANQWFSESQFESYRALDAASLIYIKPSFLDDIPAEVRAYAPPARPSRT
ncbi:hypothetical protein CTI14_67030, partial [Methylobacterium radiotolerans]